MPVDATKLRFPLTIVAAIVVGLGGTLARAKLTESSDKIEAHDKRLETLEHESQANRERVLRIEIWSEQTKNAVDRIEHKLGR